MKKYLVYILALLLFCSIRIDTSSTKANAQDFQAQTNETAPAVFTKTIKATQSETMKQILTTLQSEGFMVNNLNQKYGFISAAKEINISDKSINFSQEFDTNKAIMFAKWVKICVFDININVSETPDGTTVKIAMKQKLLNTYGNTVFIKDAANNFYESFFNKLSSAIYNENSDQ